jgi:hypothetical protein
MKHYLSRLTPSVAISAIALFVSLGGSGYAATMVLTAHNAKHLGGKPPSAYLGSRHFTSSHGTHFLQAGQSVVLGRVGDFTFTSTCSKDSMGQNRVTFDVVADTTADLDGNGPMPAGTKINIHTDSDALNSTTDNPLKPGDFTQVGSASSSTEIAQNGEEVDVFYTDGVNWPTQGSGVSDCFAGYTGLASGFPS